MLKKILVIVALTGAWVLMVGYTLATDQDRAQDREQIRIYGSQLMTGQERSEYRSRMHAAKTPEEREHILVEHHERMRLRARTKGIMLPEVPA